MTTFPDRVTLSATTTLRLDPSRLLLVFRMTPDKAGRRPEPLPSIQGQLAGLGLQLTGDSTAQANTDAPSGRARFNHSERYLWIEDPDGKDIGTGRVEKLLHAIGQQIERLAPVYWTGRGSGLRHRLARGRGRRRHSLGARAGCARHQHELRDSVLRFLGRTDSGGDRGGR